MKGIVGLESLNSSASYKNLTQGPLTITLNRGSSSASYMAQPSYYLPIANPVWVIDMNDNILFEVKGRILALHDRCTLLDPAGNPIVTLQQKIMTMHNRWQVFREESKDPADLIFSVKRSSVFQLKTKLNVYLANNTAEEVCDFRVEGSLFQRSCVIYAGESSTIVAQMHQKYTAGSILFGKDRFMVTVYPHIDYAFIAALIFIVGDINKEEDDAYWYA
ncbi:hypothetical protein ACSBR1_003434 [Camellia fascicularis]